MSNVSSARLKARYAAERRFRALGLAAVLFSALVLAFLLVTMTANAIGGFKRAELRFPIDLANSGMAVDPASLGSGDPMSQLETAGLPDVVMMAAAKSLGNDAQQSLIRRPGARWHRQSPPTRNCFVAPLPPICPPAMILRRRCAVMVHLTNSRPLPAS